MESVLGYLGIAHSSVGPTFYFFSKREGRSEEAGDLVYPVGKREGRCSRRFG